MAKAGSDTTAATGKTFSEDTVSIILMALGTTSISTTQYEMMSAMDGQKTASAFQHQFRTVLKKAKDLKQRVDDGETFAAVTPSKKRGAATDDNMTPPATPKKPKATPKPRAKKSKAKTSDPEDSPTNDLGGGGNGSPVEFKAKQDPFAFDDEV